MPQGRTQFRHSVIQLVVSQLNGAYKAKDDTMVAYVRRLQEVIKLLKQFAINLIPRSKNW